MNVELDPKSEKELLALARANGREPTEVLRELVQKAAAARKVGETVKTESKDTDPAYEPSRTELGRKLRALRRKYVEGGGRLYTVDQINAEVAEGRGER